MKYYIYGAGGHGKVVLDAMRSMSGDCAGFIDDNELVSWVGLQVSSLHDLDGDFCLHLSIGNIQTRESIAKCLEKQRFFNVSHAAAVISRTANIREGTFVAANAIVGPDVLVGSHCIINHAAVVDHDCVVGDFSHIAPKSCLGGGVKVGRGVMIGAGAVVLPGLELSDYAVVGAGAVVTKNIPTGVVVVGNPAKKMN